MVLVQALPLHAQNENNQHYYYIHGQVFNPVTRERLRHVFAELLTTDSVVVDTMTTTEKSQVNNQRGPWMFDLVKHPEQPYIVRLSKEGYQTVCINIPKQPVRAQKSKFELITFKHTYMKRAPRKYQLGQATVTASKVVFYQKGDTVVYNADALTLSEGSMLDAIIRQLPGVEMREGGEIYVNGRYVEQLLLNGKDFFDKDRQLMLDNMPSYMVKNVKVYEKESDLNKFTGLKVDEKKLVMDVNLKKEYKIGFVLNAQAGVGTENRYLSRLFALRFTPPFRGWPLWATSTTSTTVDAPAKTPRGHPIKCPSVPALPKWVVSITTTTMNSRASRLAAILQERIPPRIIIRSKAMNSSSKETTPSGAVLRVVTTALPA